ncbi:MAG: YkuJ family protein [Lactobacillaceae bacterium]|jgi:uncharacterized protein YkuJ|nr:YkuJ family protein [Lactobacillaceae bacterium]
MKNASETQLVHILNRLIAMTNDLTQNQASRRFDLFGVEIVKVDFDQKTKLYYVHDQTGSRTFVFDNIELAAIEIYQILNEMKLTF